MRVGTGLVALGATMLAATSAGAASISYGDPFSELYPLSAGSVALSGTSPVSGSADFPGPSGVSAHLPLFDPAFGTLTGVQLKVEDSAADATIQTIFTGDGGAQGGIPQVSGGVSSHVETGYAVPLASWSGNAIGPTDFVNLVGTGAAGAPSVTLNVSYAQDGVGMIVTYTVASGQLPLFVGAASFFDVFFDLKLHYDLGCTSSSSPNCEVSAGLAAKPAWTGNATVTYFYDAVPVAEPDGLPLLGAGLVAFVALRRRVA